MTTRTLRGSCLCGAVRYVVEGEARRFYHCHCSRCRKASGTGHASNLFVRGTLSWEAGEDLLTRYRVPEAERFGTSFCSRCGSSMPRYVEAAGLAFIPAGSLDTEPDILPQARIFTGSRSAWSCTAAALPEFPEYPE